MVICCDNRLIDVARKLDKADREALSHCGVYLTRLEQYAYASEVYMKMGDIKSLVVLHVKAKTWEEVCNLCIIKSNQIYLLAHKHTLQETINVKQNEN